jgi:hypothetical protein
MPDSLELAIALINLGAAIFGWLGRGGEDEK